MVEAMLGKGDVDLTTDEIMAMTRDSGRFERAARPVHPRPGVGAMVSGPPRRGARPGSRGGEPGYPTVRWPTGSPRSRHWTRCPGPPPSSPPRATGATGAAGAGVPRSCLTCSSAPMPRYWSCACSPGTLPATAATSPPSTSSLPPDLRDAAAPDPRSGLGHPLRALHGSLERIPWIYGGIGFALNLPNSTAELLELDQTALLLSSGTGGLAMKLKIHGTAPRQLRQRGSLSPGRAASVPRRPAPAGWAAGGRAIRRGPHPGVRGGGRVAGAGQERDHQVETPPTEMPGSVSLIQR